MNKFLKVSFNPYISSYRSISCTGVSYSQKNFNKFILPNRGTEKWRKRQEENPDPDIFPIRFGVRPTTALDNRGKRVEIPEKIPEIIVPDLTGFTLKPYVSYKATDVIQSEFTPKDLFNAVYSKKIKKDFQENKLDENGNPLEPSAAEMLTPEQAKKFARMTGTDLFAEGKKRD